MKALPGSAPALKPYKGGGLASLAKGEEKEYHDHYARQGVQQNRTKRNPS